MPICRLRASPATVSYRSRAALGDTLPTRTQGSAGRAPTTGPCWTAAPRWMALGGMREHGCMAPEISSITSIELLLDAAAEARIREEWQALANAGMSSMAGHEAASNRPHVTLLAQSTPVLHPLPVGGVVLPLPIVLGAPLLFGDGDRRVLARSIVPSVDLLALQGAVLDAVDAPRDDDRVADDRDGRSQANASARPEGDLQGHVGDPHTRGERTERHRFARGRWTPHVTLARRIRLVDLPEALRLLGPPIDAHGIALRRWDAAAATVASIDIR